MPTLPMPRSCAIIGKWLWVMLALLAMGSTAHTENVRAENYKNFWLWAGVRPQASLAKAKEIYLLAGEVSDRGKPHVISQRSALPHINRADLWIVYRAQTLDWNDAIFYDVLRHVQSWKLNGNRLVGLQIDFDAGTKHLKNYAIFLERLRRKLPPEFKLGVTGLLDWSANGDSRGLNALAAVVDEVVLQIYQGRRVISGYGAYLAKLDKLKVPFRIGLLQGGEWQAPPSLMTNPNFRGYVVFLVNPQYGKPNLQ